MIATAVGAPDAPGSEAIRDPDSRAGLRSGNPTPTAPISKRRKMVVPKVWKAPKSDGLAKAIKALEAQIGNHAERMDKTEGQGRVMSAGLDLLSASVDGPAHQRDERLRGANQI